jgi:hypothetical protein
MYPCISPGVWIHVAAVAMSHTGIPEQSVIRADHSPTLNDVNSIGNNDRPAPQYIVLRLRPTYLI